MIRAEHNAAAQMLFYAYTKHLIKKHFSNFYLVNEPPRIDDNASLVITPNHISWWDGFFISHLERKFYNRRAHVMMLEEQLRRHWFFSKVGAYSINPGSPKSLMETRSYTRELLSDPSNSVIIYPQGEIEDFEKRPLSLKRGFVKFLSHASDSVLVISVAVKIQFYNEMKPSIVARFAQPLKGVDIETDFSVFEDEFYANLDQLSSATEARSFVTDIFKGKPKWLP